MNFGNICLFFQLTCLVGGLITFNAMFFFFQMFFLILHLSWFIFMFKLNKQEVKQNG